MTDWLATFSNTLLFDTALIFVAGLLFALLARRFRQSPLIGYLLAGLVIGPYTLRLVPNEEHIRFLADVGVIFLMFALGVQLSLRHLLQVRTIAISVGLAQVLILIAIGTGFGRLLGLPLGADIVIGYAIALSSSVVLVRLLGDTNEFHTQHGSIALGISVMQDLMAVLLISTLPFLSEASVASYTDLTLNLGKSALFVIWTIILARWIAPIILRWASSTGSREILLPTVAVLSIGGAMVSGILGFSYALGAFLAGLVISESLFSQAVLSEVMPLRDIFGMLFFVSLGMLVDPRVIWHAGGLFAVLLIIAVLGKALVIMALVLLFRLHPYVAIVTGVSLSQIGEFSFVITREAQLTHVISADLSGLILTVAIVSIMLTPILLPFSRWVYLRFRQLDRSAAEEMGAGYEEEAVSAVLLCGYGRVGRTIAQALDTFRIPFTVIDIDRRAVEALRRRGIRAIYGDAANLRLLESIGAGKFSMAVIAVAEITGIRMIVQHMRRLNAHIRLLTRSHSDIETAHLLSMGVEGVVHVELEASLSFVREVLTTADVDEEIVAAYLEDIRIGYYEGLQPREREE